MNALILKLNATGDVVCTTPLPRRLEGDFHLDHGKEILITGGYSGSTNQFTDTWASPAQR